MVIKMKKINFLSKILATSIGLLIISCTAMAWKFEMSENNKEVLVNEGGVIRPLKMGEMIKPGSIITTGAGTKALFTDGESKMWIGEGTTLELQSDDASKPDVQSLLNLEKGRARFEIQKKEAAKYRYRTRSSVAGIRGTEFFMSATESEEQFCVFEGVIEVSNNSKTFKVPSGAGLKITKGADIKTTTLQLKDVESWKQKTFFKKASAKSDSGVN
jgi:hypothetical protein